MTTITTGVLAYFLLLLSLTGITPTVSENMPALGKPFVCQILLSPKFEKKQRCFSCLSLEWQHWLQLQRL